MGKVFRGSITAVECRLLLIGVGVMEEAAAVVEISEAGSSFLDGGSVERGRE